MRARCFRAIINSTFALLLVLGKNKVFISLSLSLLWLGHHHLAELVKVHGAAAVLVQFL